MDSLAMTTAPRRSRILSFLTCRPARWALGFCLAGLALSAQAFFSLGHLPGIYIPQTYFKFGAVYTRAIVPGPGGRPVYVEYGTNGKEAREIGEAVGQYEKAKVMAAGSYRSLLQRLEDSKARHPDQVVMKASDYKGMSFTTVGGEPISKPDVASDTLTVVVRPDKQRFLKDGSDLVLLELPINPDNQPSGGSKALLLSEEGDILHQTENSIGFRVGFFGQNGQVADTTRRNVGKDKIYGPLPNVGVNLSSHVIGGYALTDGDGKFRMRFLLPACPGFFFEYTTPIYLELYYKRFNPRSKSHMPYYMSRPGYDSCNGLGVWDLNAAMIIATQATPVHQPDDFPIDLMVLDGSATLKGATLDAQTAYNGETSEYKKQLQEKYDFDGDEKPDWVVPGKKVKKQIDGEEKEVFETTAVDQAELQGIYLSSRFDAIPADTEKTAPDFTRLIDTAPDFKDRGLLKTIGKEDLKDTDIYVFRESTGQLIAERRGLHEDELYKNYSGVDEQAGSFRYTIQLRGAIENYYTISYDKRGEAGFKKWQSAGGFKEEFQKRTANHLKAGETVRIIAINRPTGYQGSVRVPLQAATASGNFLNFADQRIELAAPNLKIWAERKNKVEQGMTKGETRKQLIGNEGAGLGSDISIAIYTDWRDQDGSPLPEELGDYGYTGRLAKIVAQNQLAPSGVNNLSQFKIKPGQAVQVITLPERVLAKQHLYLQVAGQPENRNPDFASGGGEGILQYRPKRFVPVQVPVHDEESSEIARQAYRKIKDEKPELDLKKPEPIYQWFHRPELQFSLYELSVTEIRRRDYAGAASDIYREKTPTFSSSDTYAGIIYDLLKSSFDTLEAWSYQGPRELVLAFGEQEIKAKIGQAQNIEFENIDHLASLDPDDFLSLRLYSNNDVGNVLFEFAFEHLSLQANTLGYNNQTEETWYVTADDPKVPLRATLLGYADRNPKVKKPLALSWQVEGDGDLTTSTQSDSDLGVFPNLLTMPTRAGSTGRVKALLRESETEAVFKKVKVLAGKPASITIEASGKAAAMEADKLQMVITVKDAHGNVVEDGTSVNISVNQDALVPIAQPGTVNGVVTATITGNAFATPSAKMTVKSGDVTKEFDFEIEGLTVAIQGSSDLLIGRQENLQVQVNTSGGKAAAGVLVSFSSNLGFFPESQYQTDASGHISVPFNAGPMAGSGTWTVRAGYAGGTKQNFTVRSSGGGGAQADVRDLMLLGDRPNGGPVTYNRYDGTAINLDYQTSGELKVKGQAGDTVQVQLGDLIDPNVEPLLAYYMNDLEDVGSDPEAPAKILSDIPDELGLRTGTGTNVEVVADHPLGRGSSYLFDGSARIEAASDTVLMKPEQTGFRIDFKATQAGGEIFNLGGGQRLILSGSTLRYEIETDEGQHSVVKTGITLHHWHSVGGRYANGQLELQVDGTPITAPASGAVQYSGSQLILGQGYQGNLNSFRLYDWTSQPLVQLAGGGATQAVQLSGSGEAALVVESTGQLGALQSNSTLRTLRVAVTVDGARQFVSLLSSQAYIDLGGQYLESFSSAAPPVDVGGLNYQPLPWFAGLTIAPLDYMIPKAYAEESGVWSFIKGAANFLIPLEDFKILGEQLYYMATGDWERFDAMELSFAALGVATVLPVMKPLKLVLNPLKKFIRQYGRNPIVKALAGVLGRATEEAVKGRTQKLVSLLPYFLIVVEMLESPEGPAAILAMVDAIESPDDLWAWIEYFNLPADGWEGTEIPGVAAAEPVERAEALVTSAVEFFVPSAYAARRLSRNRLAGKKAAEEIVAATKVAGSPKNFSILFKELVQSLKDPSASALRPLAHSRALIISGLGIVKSTGVNAVRNLIRNRPDDRISRVMLAAIVTYVETRLSEGKLPASIREKVWTLYGLSLVSNNETQRHGGTFQLMMLAYYHALHEYGNEPAVLDLEASQNIVYKTSGGKALPAYGRRVDIVLGTEQDQKWIEIKSLLAARFIPSGFNAGSSYHREFYADLLASNGLLPNKSVNALWRFHSFSAKDGSKSPTSSEFTKFDAKKYLCEPAKDVSVTKSLGKPMTDSAMQALCKSSQDVRMMTNRVIIKDILTSKEFTDEFKKILEEVGGLD